MAHAGELPQAGRACGGRSRRGRARGGPGGRRLPVLTQGPEPPSGGCSRRSRPRPITEPAALVRLHETLCFLQAYPGRPRDPRPRGRPPSWLSRAHSAGSGREAQARLHDSGIAGSILEYPYGLPLSRWLAARLGRHADVGWAGIPDTEKIADALDLLVTPSESDAFSEGGFTVRRWLEVARAGRRLTDLQVLVEAFDRAPLDPGLRDWLYESLGLPVRIRLAAPGRLANHGQATGGAPGLPADAAPARRVSTSSGRRRGRSRRFTAPRGPLAGELIETARVAMATRSRELHAFSYPNVRGRAGGGGGARAARGADRAPAGIPAAVRGLLRVPGDPERRAGELRRRVVPLRDAGVRVQRLRVLPAGGVGVDPRPGPPRLSPGLRHAHRGGGSLPAGGRQPRGAPVRGLLLLPAPRVPAADRHGPARPGGGAREDRARPAVSLTPLDCSDGSRGRRRASPCPAAAPSRSAGCGRAIWPRW